MSKFNDFSLRQFLKANFLQLLSPEPSLAFPNASKSAQTFRRISRTL